MGAIAPLAPALKASTRPAHQRLEARLDLLARVRDLESYTAVLAAMRGFYAPLERALVDAPVLAGVLPDLAGRRKLHLLDADLADLGVDGSGLPECGELPILETTPRALGAAYVVEGATLGGAGISRHVRATLPDPAPRACRFFAPYGARTGAMWLAFRATLEATHADRTDVLTGAAETFAALEAWLDQRGVLR